MPPSQLTCPIMNGGGGGGVRWSFREVTGHTPCVYVDLDTFPKKTPKKGKPLHSQKMQQIPLARNLYDTRFVSLFIITLLCCKHANRGKI